MDAGQDGSLFSASLARIGSLRECWKVSRSSRGSPSVRRLSPSIFRLGFGHAEPGGRECDRQARELLGWPRRNSVFSPPVRSALFCSTFEQACATNAKSSPIQSRISRQCFALLAKLREVDELMSPDLQVRIREVHPELCFFELNGGRAMLYGKHTPRGGRGRIDVLMETNVVSSPAMPQALKSGGVDTDDVLDALVACWTAERIQKGCAVSHRRFFGYFPSRADPMPRSQRRTASRRYPNA
jgi:predicted RNase H-like nuclease